MANYVERPDGMVVKYEDYGVVSFIPPDTNSPAYQDYLTWKDTNASEQSNQTILRQRAANALQTNRNQAAQNDNIISQASQIEQFTGTTLTQAQIISTFKQLAAGVRILAEHDKTNKQELNEIIRLVLQDLSGLD